MVCSFESLNPIIGGGIVNIEDVLGMRAIKPFIDGIDKFKGQDSLPWQSGLA